MKKIVCLLLLTINISAISFAENENDYVMTTNSSLSAAQKSGFSFSKINIGGNIGGGFSNNDFFFNVQPRISYRLRNWIVPGVSFLYQYSSEKDSRLKWTTNIWGAGVFANIYPVRFIYGHIEYQQLWYKQKVKNSSYPDVIKDNDSFLLLGVGAVIPVGSNFFMNASILFNVLEDENSIYQNPIYSVGFGVNL